MHYKRRKNKLEVFNNEGKKILSEKRVRKCRIHKNVIALLKMKKVRHLYGGGSEEFAMWNIYDLKGKILWKNQVFYWSADDFIVLKEPEPNRLMQAISYDKKFICDRVILYDNEGFIYLSKEPKPADERSYSITMEQYKLWNNIQGKKGKLLKPKRKQVK